MAEAVIFLSHVNTGSRAHSLSIPVGTGISFHRGNSPKHSTDHHSHPSADKIYVHVLYICMAQAVKNLHLAQILIQSFVTAAVVVNLQ